MFPQLYTGASGMVASERSLDVVTNNLANARTVGYVPDRPLFSTYLDADIPEPANALGNAPRQVEMSGLWRPDEPGPLSSTGNEFDLALRAPGFFRVATPGGERLTRAGSMTRLEGGVLASREGFPLLDEAGRQIVLPEGKLAIASDGTVSVNEEIVARLGIAAGGLEGLTREGDTLWRPQGAVRVLAAEDTQVAQGFLEQSGTQPTSEMVSMIEAQRLFEMQQRVVNVTVNTVAKRALELSGAR